MTDSVIKNSEAVAALLEESILNETVEDDDIPEEEEIKEENKEETPEEKVEIEIDPKEELEFNRLTSGWTKKEKAFVKSIKDPKLKAEAIESTKERRVDFDRRSLELGNTKKELAEMRAKIEDLTLKQYKPVADEDDEYLTEQELKLKTQLEDVKTQLGEIKQDKANSDAQAVQQEIERFKQTSDDDGNLKFPHFERVRGNMSLLLQIDPTHSLTLEKAYNKALLLDDELAEETREEGLLKDKLNKQATLDKVKKNKKYTPTTTGGNRNLSAKEKNERSIAASDLY